MSSRFISLQGAAADDSGVAERSMAAAHMQLGSIAMQQGKLDLAAEHHQKGHRLVEALHQANPQSMKATGNLAATESSLGVIAQLRRDRAAALKHYQRALELLQPLMSRTKGDELTPEEIRLVLATTYDRIASLHRTLDGDLNLAESNLRKALEVRKEVAVTDLGETTSQALADSHYALADMALRKGESGVGLEHAHAAADLRSRLLAGQPRSLSFKRLLASSQGQIGDLHLILGDTLEDSASARKHYTLALDLSKEVGTLDDDSPAQRALAFDYYRVATACLRLGDKKLSDDYYAQSLKIREALAKRPPLTLDSLYGLMIARARCGKHEQALSIAKQIQEQHSIQPNAMFQVACCYAICAATTEDAVRQRQLAKQAVEAARQAVNAGFRDAVKLRTDPDLDCIRDDPDLQMLIKSL